MKKSFITDISLTSTWLSHIALALTLLTLAGDSEANNKTKQHSGLSSVAVSPVSSPQAPVLHTLPIGSGNCQVLQCPQQNKLIVYDCGSRKKGKQAWAKQNVVEYLDNLAKPDTELVVAISHRHADHINYLPYVMSNIKNKQKVVAAVIGEKVSGYSDAVQAWLQSDPEQGGPAQKQSFNGQFDYSKTPEYHLGCPADNLTSYVLTVNAGQDPNSRSMVVANIVNGRQFLMTGDMTSVTERAIDIVLNSNNHIDLINTNVLTAPHHGSVTHGSNSTTWAEKTTPSLVIVSAGEKYHHPRCAAINRYTSVQTKQSAISEHKYTCATINNTWQTLEDKKEHYVTNESGVVTVTFNKTGTITSQIQHY